MKPLPEDTFGQNDPTIPKPECFKGIFGGHFPDPSDHHVTGDQPNWQPLRLAGVRTAMLWLVDKTLGVNKLGLFLEPCRNWICPPCFERTGQIIIFQQSGCP